MYLLPHTIPAGPGVDSASNRNEYQEHFLRGKGGRCQWLTTLPPLHTLKSGSLKLLEPSGPVQACTGTVLCFTNTRNTKQCNGLFVPRREHWPLKICVRSCREKQDTHSCPAHSFS